MKKLLVTIITLAILVSLTSCGVDKTSVQSTNQSSKEIINSSDFISSGIVSEEIINSSEDDDVNDTDDKQTITVYVTETGEKYHSDGCQYLSKSQISIDLSEAKRSYSPCSKCNPPE